MLRFFRFLRRQISKLSPFRLFRSRHSDKLATEEAKKDSNLPDYQKEKATYEYAMKIKELDVALLRLNYLILEMFIFLQRQKSKFPLAIENKFDELLKKLNNLRASESTDTESFLDGITGIYNKFIRLFEKNLSEEDAKFAILELQQIYFGADNPGSRVPYTPGFSQRIHEINQLRQDISVDKESLLKNYGKVPTYSWTKPKAHQQFDYEWTNHLLTEKKFKAEEKPAMQRTKASSSSNSTWRFWRRIFRTTKHDSNPVTQQALQRQI